MQDELESLRYRIREFMRTEQDKKEVLMVLVNYIEQLESRIVNIESDLKYHTHKESGNSSLLQEWC